MSDVQLLSASWVRAIRRLVLDEALAQVAERLRERGVEPLLLKGPDFAQWLYAADGERSYNDIDILVAPDEFAAARSVLAELGFVHRPVTARRSASHHEVWEQPSAAGAKVELHHTLSGIGASPELAWRRLSASAELITVNGTTVQAPAIPVRALIVALHAAHHGAVGRQHIADLERALARVEPIQWQAAARLAQELGAIDAFALGLRLVPGGRDLARQLALPSTTSRAARLRASGPPDTAMGIERLVAAGGIRGRIQLIRGELLPAPSFMRTRYRLARRGRRGLLASYAVRPGLIAAKLPAGWSAWMHARTGSASPSAPDRE